MNIYFYIDCIFLRCGIESYKGVLFVFCDNERSEIRIELSVYFSSGWFIYLIFKE